MAAQIPYGQVESVRDSLIGRELTGSRGIRYFVRELVGEGGQGWVFTANWDDPDGLLVIVKVLRPDVVTDDTLDRFRREAQALRMLEQKGPPSPHIVRFYDHATATIATNDGKSLKLPFTVLEYVRGTNLERVVEDAGGRGLPLERVRRILRQVVLGLESVHAQNVIHRDLKPSNILLSSESGTEVAKITDFGLVKFHAVDMKATVTLAGATLGYAPPEQFEPGNDRVGPHTDVFSLGAIVFELLTGSRAYDLGRGENPLTVVRRIIQEDRQPLARFISRLDAGLSSRPALVEEIEAIIKKALRSDLAARYPTVAAIWAELDPLLRKSMEPLPGAAAVKKFDGNRSDLMVDSRVDRMSAPLLSGQQPKVQVESLRWTFRVSPSEMPLALRAAAFLEGGSVVALDESGLVRWDARAGWRRVALPHGMLASHFHAVCAVGEGDAFVVGEHAVVLHIGARGSVTVRRLTNEPMTFLGATRTTEGNAALVGYQATTSGKNEAIVVEVNGERMTRHLRIPGVERLFAVHSTPDSGTLATGEHGAIVRVALTGQIRTERVCEVDLLAVTRYPDGAYGAVGRGGHALRVTSTAVTLERVQTLQDLMSIAVSPSGIAFAGAAKGRILVRQASGWQRVGAEVAIEGDILAFSLAEVTTRAVTAKGSFVEGEIAR